MAPRDLCNGERAVVFLFVTRVLFSIPFPLFYEAAALCLLAIAGLVVEILAENSSALDRFKTRPGVSSGILLGAVTVPTVMLSRLIQMSRALSANDIELGGSAYLNVQYWAVSAGCFAVLLFIYRMLQQSSKNTTPLLCNSKASKCSLLYLASYTLMSYLSFAMKSYRGWYFVINLSWLLFHALSTVILIQHILQTFPSCASIGEALLVSSGLVLYFGDMLTYTLSKINSSYLSSKFKLVNFGNRSKINTFLQGVLLGLLLLPIFYKFALQILLHFTTSEEPADQVIEGRTYREIVNSIVFYVSLFVILTLIVPAWMYFVQDFHVHPVLWYISSTLPLLL